MFTKRSQLCALVMTVAACTLDNPCPRGTARGGSACRTLEAESGATEVGETDDPWMDAAVEEDAASSADDDVSASRDDASPSRDDASPPDEDTGQPAATDADTPLACTDEARDAWRRFQISDHVVSSIVSCYRADPHCSKGDCALAGCLQSSAHVTGCDGCIAAEISCAIANCRVPCSVPTDDDACRACACANHCLDATSGCGAGSVDACADCSAAGCSAGLAALTDTITIPIFFHLMHDRVDPATGIPAYAVSASEQETILDIDERLAAANSSLDAARSDGRRLRLIRAGVSYAPASGACPDPVAASDARRMFRALNLVLAAETATCAAAATSAFAGRASGASLLRTVGNMLGIAPADQRGDPWQITPQQLVRMHDYARWRVGAGQAVPQAERATNAGFPFGPQDPIWDEPTNRATALANASLYDATAPGPFSSLPAIEQFVVPSTSATRSVLGVRVSARFTGVPSQDLRVVVDSQRDPRSPITPVPRSALWVGEGTLVAEEAFDASSELGTWSYLRHRYAPGRWTVSIDDSADLTITDIRLEIVLGDRIFDNYDRHARGISDILVYRRATSELFTVMNPADGGRSFGAATSEPVPPLPDPEAEVMSGDVDGDGTVDLLARRGASIWVAFNKRGFAPWRAGSVEGSDRPALTDDIRLGDFDKDGFGDLLRRRPDLAANQSRWAFHRGGGDGTFEGARVPVLSGDPYPADMRFTVADWGRMGRSTLMLRYARQPYVLFTHNDSPRPTTSGTTPAFAGPWGSRFGTEYAAFSSSEQVVVLDTNQDGSQDLVARRPGSGEWFVCINGADENFTTMQPLTIGGGSTAFTDSDTILNAAPP